MPFLTLIGLVFDHKLGRISILVNRNMIYVPISNFTINYTNYCAMFKSFNSLSFNKIANKITGNILTFKTNTKHQKDIFLKHLRYL